MRKTLIDLQAVDLSYKNQFREHDEQRNRKVINRYIAVK